ncbi:MAG: hypothetical protein US42_C0003G0055 [Candidatus Magasanikbacteria bacterium GW2011_GWC2_37_14]|uniref:Uncharacterized protein n=1 Tax=Candidatus Magasanikbacteria bacterium GW2011_GWC2_37_14 TaxID=1619046 RepID=A0A0G0GA49_9BACT|nr:MAG: hypothetical protein US42_C0003G0055 [Candidatus Magasanikbacteria bacterium GW2011_GWC2_37_14]
MYMLTLRQRIFAYIGIFVGLVVVFLLAYLFINNSGGVRDYVTEKGTKILNIKPTGEQTPVATTTPNVVKADPLTPEIYTKQLSRIFVERFSSYSNQNDNLHISEVIPLCTETMVAWLKTQNLTSSLDYAGVTTRVIASNVSKITATSATVEIQVQQEIENKAGKQVVQKDGRVELLKVGNDWKIDGLYWQK